jgi:hypothetical protein
MNRTSEYLTLLACYLPTEWGKAYYDDPEYLYDRWELHYFPVNGLADEIVQDLQERELSSYAYRIVWNPSNEALLVSCLSTELEVAFNVESDKEAFRNGLRKTLLQQVKEHLKGCLLEQMKAQDDTESVREYVQRRAKRQLAGDFSPYGSGEGALRIAPCVQTDSVATLTRSSNLNVVPFQAKRW